MNNKIIKKEYQFKKPTSQNDLNEFFQYIDYKFNVELKDTIDGMMNMQNFSGSFENKEISIEFPIMPWQLNHKKVMQGGMYVVAMDVTSAILNNFFYGVSFSPTTDINIKYLRPIKAGDTMISTASEIKFGKSLSTIQCISKRKSDGKIIASATITFMIMN